MHVATVMFRAMHLKAVESDTCPNRNKNIYLRNKLNEKIIFLGVTRGPDDKLVALLALLY